MEIDHELILNCIKRNNRAEYQLYKLTYSYLMSICIRYTRNELRAKEALNIGFLKILTHLDKYKSEIPFKVWIRKIMINTLINEYKKEKVHHSHTEYVENYHDSSKYADINEAITRINSEEIYAFIAQLPLATKQVFNLYFIDGYKHKEIAELLEISEGTSKWHLNSAREKLKEIIKKNGLLIKLTHHD
jgi:RNA polymerase sigma factor (sigma-70 family)